MRHLLLGFLLLAACGEAPAHGPCESGGDCEAPADGCYRLSYRRSDGSEGTGRTCSQRCAADGDCLAGSVCLALEGDPARTFLCHARCSEPMDCFEGHACTRAGEGSICLPAGD